MLYTMQYQHFYVPRRTWSRLGGAAPTLFNSRGVGPGASLQSFIGEILGH